MASAPASLRGVREQTNRRLEHEHNHDRGPARGGPPPDRPAAGARADRPVAETARIQRHLDALHQEEASVLAAARQAPDEVEEKLGQLRTRLAVAENSLAADVSDDWTTFAAAVEDELRSWDTYLERLQATAAAKAWNARERAEAAIADVRTRRIAVYDRLAQARDARRRRLAGAEEPRQRGSRRARTEGRRTVGEVQLKGAQT